MGCRLLIGPRRRRLEHVGERSQALVDDDCDGVEAGPMTALAGKEVVEGVLSTLTHGLMQRS